MMSSDRPSLHHVLRSATADHHTVLDHRIGSVKPMTSERYGTVLRAIEAAQRAVERHLGCTDVSDSGHRQRARLAAQDLHELGVEPLPELTLELDGGDSVAAGVLYVAEGSTLGARHVERWIPAGSPRRFLTAYGDETLSRWRSTLRWIDRHGDPSVSVPAAQRTFDLFQHSMDCAERLEDLRP